MVRYCQYTLLAVLCCSLPATGQELRWRSGDLLAGASAGERLARADLVRRLELAGRHRVLVRFERSPSAHEKELWRAAGLVLGRALGAGAYFAHVRAGALDAQALTRLPGLLEVRALDSLWKLDPALAGGEALPWAVVARDEQGEVTVVLYVLLQEGVPLERGDAVLRSLGGSTFEALESVHGLVAFLPRERVTALASADEVAWVEPALPQMEGVALAVAPPAPNDSNRARVQADRLQEAPYALDGAGVDVLVYDGGVVRASHADFGGRCAVRDASPEITHATHVAATLAGNGAASGGVFRGMAPAATIQSFGFEFDFTGVFLFTNPGDFERDYEAALDVRGAGLANNSIVSNIECSGFHCPIQGDYGVMCSLIDGAVRGSLGTPWRIIWAAGNERVSGRCDIEGFGGYFSLPPPATAKNHIAVGALNADDESMTYFSSWGPTDDGRMKPDVCAPGCEVGGDGGVTSASATSDLAYETLCGTSTAAPTVCGVAALLVQDWRRHFGTPDPLNSTLKVLLVHTAADRGARGPDYQFGYGSVRARDAVELVRQKRFVESVVTETGARARWHVDVGPSTDELCLTLAWDDAPGQPNVFGSLVNELDLVVRDPLGVQHHVWTLDPDDPSAPATRTRPGRRDNIEQVLVDAPSSGTWTVEVRAHDLAEGPQTFSLASSRALVAPPQVSISFPDPLPVVLTPGVGTPLVARIVGVNDDVVEGSPTLHVRYDGGAFLALAMDALGDSLYWAELPPAVCTAAPEFYVSATGVASGASTQPAEAPREVLRALVGAHEPVFVDDFEQPRGWTTTHTNIFVGRWDRGLPFGDGTAGDPLTAWGGDGRCYLTGRQAGFDVDGGPTRLLSPILDLSDGLEFEVSFVRWFTNSDFDADALVVEISNDAGASWTAVEEVTRGGSGGGWVRRSFRVNEFLAPTSQVQLRFSVSDVPDDSITEAGLDEFSVTRIACGGSLDCNANGIADANDIASARSADDDRDGIPDECHAAPPGRARPSVTSPGPGPTVRKP